MMKQYTSLRIPPDSSRVTHVTAAAMQPNLVSIIILTFNQLKYTKECVESIRKHTPEPHEIIFVDNGSTDVTGKWLKKLVENNSNYRLIANTKNLGFSKGCNQGIEASTGEYILLLNNDVVVTENWLAGMLECIKSAPDIGIVGPMTNNISGPQKVPDAGYSSIDGLSEYAMAFRQKNRHRRIACRRIVGFCMLFKQRLIEEVGSLDESFGSGNFEDDDLCLRVSLAGYRNVMAGDVFIHHYGSRSFMANRIDYGSSLSGNRKIFSEKWRGKEVVQRYGRKLLIENAVVRADEIYRKGDIDKATASMLEAIKQAPDDRSLYFKLAEMLIDGKRYNDALGILEAVPQGDNDVRQLALLGYCEEGLGHNDKAQEYAAHALAIDPSMVLALNVAGVVQFKKGEKVNAEGLFKKAMDSDPGFGESYTNLGSLQWAAGEHTEALNLFERGFILSPTVADVVTAYHSAVAATGSFARAEPVFFDARALHPIDKRIAFFLIAMLIQQEKHDLATREIEQAMIQFGIDDGILNAALQIRAKTGPLEIRPGSTQSSLSICMIVKNEELSLAKCLMSVKPVADEIIVVDTGSADKTKAIASALGAKVFDFPWTNDFSEARNYSLSKASGGWILVLDADELVSPLDHDKLKKLINSKAEKRVAYTMVTRNYTDQAGSRDWSANEGRYIHEEIGRGWIPSPKVRLFANDKRINFVNPVHELVEPTLEKLGIKIKTCDVPVHHYGRLNQDKLIAKGKEYYRLGIAKIEKSKGEGEYNALRELAIQAAEIGEYAEAVNVWEKALELKSNDAVAFMNMGFAFLMMKQYEKAAEHSKKAMDLDPDFREAALNYSAAELIAGDVKKAISTLENILKNNTDYPPAMGRLAAACMIDGRKEEGLRYLDRLITKGFDCSSMMEEQSRAFLSEGRIEQAVLLLQAALEKGLSNISTHALLAECQQKMKCST
jgi:GT2 family glycosyltransferase/Flp pilus assembly protein TadD